MLTGENSCDILDGLSPRQGRKKLPKKIKKAVDREAKECYINMAVAKKEQQK